MATISNTPRPGYVWDATDNCWYPIGTGPHSHADYITAGSAINPNIVDAKGDIIAATAADTVARLAVGSNDQVLTADSSTATGLKWATPAAGGMTLISETVASGLSSLSLSSIPQTYKQLLLVWSGINHSATGSGFGIRINNSSGIDYAFSGLYTSGGANGSYFYLTSYLGSDDTFYSFGQGVNYSQIERQCWGWLQIDNYASTTKHKAIKWDCGYFDSIQSGFGQARMGGFWEETSAITSLDVVRLKGSATFSNSTNTSIRLYGVS